MFNVPVLNEKCINVDAQIPQAELSVLRGFGRGLYFVSTNYAERLKQLIAWLKMAKNSGYACTWVNWSEVLIGLRHDARHVYAEIGSQTENSKCIFIDDFETGGRQYELYAYTLVKRWWLQGKLLYISGNELVTEERIASILGRITFQYEVVSK